MNDLPRNKYEILDIVFTFLIALCMVLTAILILSNMIVSLIFVIVVVLFAFVVLFLWISRNPFNIYLVRALAFNNFYFTFIALILFSYRLSYIITGHRLGYTLLLFPSGIYLIISFKFSAVSTLRDKRVGAMLAFAGRTKASRRLLFKDNMEERIKREELIAKQKKVYRYKLIIALTIALTLSSFAALIFGFY
jgi:heme/copper-type cytochrome/quinol oxidase subunit 4